MNPVDWTVADVASYFTAVGFPEQALAFRTQVYHLNYITHKYPGTRCTQHYLLTSSNTYVCWCKELITFPGAFAAAGHSNARENTCTLFNLIA